MVSLRIGLMTALELNTQGIGNSRMEFRIQTTCYEHLPLIVKVDKPQINSLIKIGKQ